MPPASRWPTPRAPIRGWPARAGDACDERIARHVGAVVAFVQQVRRPSGIRLFDRDRSTYLGRSIQHKRRATRLLNESDGRHGGGDIEQRT
jgi:hypothetical protein